MGFEMSGNVSGNVIETNDLTKLYDGKGGCRGICLSVSGGQIFGFLGPNGAGKSTLVKMLVGLLFPTSGSAFLLGRPLGDLEARRRIGFLPENFRYHHWLNGFELLDLHGSLYGMTRSERKRRIPEVLELVGLGGKGRQKVGGYSKGMQQRIGLACALIPDPDLVFLDEPTSALDPIGRREVREILKYLRQRGKTVFLNSHLLSEVEMICDQVAVINKGRIVASGQMEELLAGETEVEVEVGGLNEKMLEALGGIGEIKVLDGTRLTVKLERRRDIPRVAGAVLDCGGQLYRLNPRGGSLEDLFVSLVEGGEPDVDYSGIKFQGNS